MSHVTYMNGNTQVHCRLRLSSSFEEKDMSNLRCCSVLQCAAVCRCVFQCVCVCIYMCVYVYIYTQICIYVYIYIHIYVCINCMDPAKSRIRTLHVARMNDSPSDSAFFFQKNSKQLGLFCKRALNFVRLDSFM